MVPRPPCVVITGATRGIGAAAAGEMLSRDPDLHLIVLARAGSGQLSFTAGPGRANRVRVVSADLASLASVRSAVTRIGGLLRDAGLELTGLVANAGLQLTTTSQVTVDGIETTFAVNVVSNFVLVKALSQQFTTPARVVLTTSDTHFGDLTHNLGMVPAPDWLDPERLLQPDAWPDLSASAAGRTAYSTSKLAVIYLVHALAQRLPSGIDVFSFNPGLVPGTGLVRDGKRLERFAFSRLLPMLTRTPLARTVTQAGSDLAMIALGEVEAPSGSYFNGAKAERSSPESYDLTRSTALWECLQRLAAEP